MKLTHTLLATVAMVALAGPAFAQSNPTLLTAPTTTQAAVTTTVANACAITGSLTAFLMTVTPNGVITAPSAQPITVTCNTPNGNITVGSNDMVNSGAPAIIETATFTNTLAFIGQADGLTDGNAWRLDSRASTFVASSATIGFDTTRRVRVLNVSVEGATAGGKLPVAGAYAGRICVTVDPSGSLTTNGTTNVDTSCTTA